MSKLIILKLICILPDWKTYFASDCIKVAGQVGGDNSSGSLFSLNVSSKPNPDMPSGVETSWTLPSPCKSDNPKLKSYDKECLAQIAEETCAYLI